jgi:hypothetical protein
MFRNRPLAFSSPFFSPPSLSHSTHHVASPLTGLPPLRIRATPSATEFFSATQSTRRGGIFESRVELNREKTEENIHALGFCLIVLSLGASTSERGGERGRRRRHCAGCETRERRVREQKTETTKGETEKRVRTKVVVVVVELRRALFTKLFIFFSTFLLRSSRAPSFALFRASFALSLQAQGSRRRRSTREALLTEKQSRA